MKVKPIQLTKLFITINILIVTILMFLGVIAFLMLQNQVELGKSQEMRLKSYIIANELKQSSDDLTRYCRAYVSTGSNDWEQKYWELLDIRNGKKPWPNGRTIALLDSMKKLGFTEAEFDKLKEAEQNSAELVWTEKVAFNAMKGLFDDGTRHFTIKGKPNSEFAQRILFDKKYVDDKSKVLAPIVEFFILFDQRTHNKVNEYNRKSNDLLMGIIGFIILITGIVAISYFILRKKIVDKLEELRLMYKKSEESDIELKMQNEELKQITETLELRSSAHEASEEMIRAIFNIADVGISITDENGKYLLFNDWWPNKLGYTTKEMEQLSNIETTHPEDQEETRYWYGKVIQNDLDKYHLEKRYLKKDGSFFWGDLSVSTIRNRNSNTINLISVIVDITERKKAEVHIINQNDQLHELNSTKDKFISILAHDLKNPLNSLIGLSKFLLEEINGYDIDKTKEFLLQINATSKETYSLLIELLEWSQAQQNRTSYNPININLHSIARECISSLYQQASVKNIEISHHIPKDITIFADAELVKAIFRNLITNAIKFTPNSGKIEVTAKADRTTVEVSVKDNGVGMDTKTRNTLFKICETESREGTAQERGTGFGLLLCKEFVKKHNGNIWVESELGQGSTFSFTLPLTQQS